MAPQIVFLGMGSNLGDRHHMLQQALDALRALPETTILACSRIYETEPWGGVAQGAFHNCAVEIRTTLQPMQLLTAVKNIEREMGRVEVQRNGPRLIDIDILLFGDIVMKQEGLAIPHPAMAERPFVLIPLREIAPDAVHPTEKLTIEELALRCGDHGVVDTGIELTVASGEAPDRRD
ncbi:MAG: 2-amino-4-hydroxy-6-hydroxymethyldihydropteridine diphosphokinase [Bacteroidetes bacterium]|nr:2-amino-4-hydroxy-6-hydroxymethyldihydropteridine diphosphokinase [Bacteroidota bacterium]